MKLDNLVETYVFSVHFAGFESDTYRLQRNGWNLAFNRPAHKDTIQIAMRHEKAGLYAMSNDLSFESFYSLSKRPDSSINPFQPGIVFNIIHVFNQGRVQIFPVMGAAAWTPFDATPSFAQTEELPFDKWVPFKSINPDAPDIVIPEHTLPELLDIILNKQDPKQKEIRERQRKEAWLREAKKSIPLTEARDFSRDIKAQIITVAS